MLAEARHPKLRQARRGRGHRPAQWAPRRRGAERTRRLMLMVAILLALPALVSYGQMLSRPSDSSLSIRTVEWLRDNGLRGIVNRVENIYYSLNAPAAGGPALRSLPRQPGAGASSGPSGGGTGTSQRSYSPRRIRPVIHPALPGEGVWHPTFSGVRSDPPVLVTSFRPEAAYPQNVAGVAWINHSRTSTWLYPGAQEPSVPMVSRGPEEVPLGMRKRLVATFNSGFKLSDSHGGFASGGHTYAPLKDGMATILRYRNGTVDVRAWSGGPDASPAVVYARQNLPLIVNDGHLNPNLSDGPAWGETLGNSIRVWRSGVGVDRHGNLIYAAANYMTVGSLARILQRAGAVRAMQLDINSYWTSFISYRRPGAGGAANLLSSMDRSSQRYLTPDDRDFFAVYLK
jgi:hypothetical protein